MNKKSLKQGQTVMPVKKKQSWFKSFNDLKSRLRRPENREQLFAVIKEANYNQLIDQNSVDTIERLLHVSELRVRDVMIPRSQVVVVNRDDDPEDMLPVLINSAHSRFPVIDGDRDKIIGILLAKDLLRYFYNRDEEFFIRDVLRPAVFVPESKRLNVLLTEFQESRNHMAVVVDEFGGVSGLVTIEDVIEQIVGDIEDEHDYDEEESMVMKRSENEYVIKARLSIDEFNERFSTKYNENDFDTIGGLILAKTEHLPKRGDVIQVDHFQFEVLNADSRRIHLLKLIV